MLEVSTAWKNAARISRRSVVLVRLYYGPGGASDYLALGSESMVLEGVHYRGLLAKGALPSTEMGLDIKTHVVQISTTKMKINNGKYNPGKRFCDFIGDTSLGSGDDWGLENRRCEIVLWTEGITTWADCVQQFDGLIRDINHDDKVAVVPLQSRQELVYQEIGSRLTDADAADPGQGLPEESRGKIKPFVGGDHRYNQGSISKTVDTTLTFNNRTPCRYLGTDSDNKHHYLISKHKLDQILFIGESTEIWGYDDRIKRSVRLRYEAGMQIEKNDSTGCVFSIPNDSYFIDYWYGKGTVSVVKSVGASYFANPERMIDKLFGDYSSGGVLATGGIGDYTRATIPFPDYDYQIISDDDIDDIRVFLYGKLFYYGGAGDGDFAVELDGLTLSMQYPTGAAFPNSRMYRLSDLTPGSKENIAKDITVELRKLIDANGEYAIFHVYEVYKGIPIRAEGMIPLFFAGRGVEYPDAPNDWISGRTQTEPHIDNNQIGLLIENPAGLQESILRDELGEGDGEINLASFNVASNDLPNWKMAPAIIKERGSKGLQAELGRESRSFVWPGPDGKWKMRVLEDTYSAADIVLDCKRAIGKVKFSRSPLKDLVTSVTAYYDYNGERYLSKTGTANDTRMQDKWKVTGTQSKRFPKANHLHDQATVEAWRDYFLAQWKQPHIGFVGLWGVEAVHGDVADIAELLNPPYKPYGLDITQNNEVAGQDILKYWWILNVRRQADRIRIKGFQLHDLSS